MTETSGRLISALADALAAQEDRVEKIVAARGRIRIEMFIVCLVVFSAGAAALGATLGGHALAQNLMSVAAVVLPIGIARFAYILGKSEELRVEYVHIAETLGPLRVLAEDARMDERESKHVYAHLNAIDAYYADDRS